MRPTHKCHDHVPRRRFVEEHFGVARDHHLALLLTGGLAEDVVDLALAQNFQVGIWFVEEQYGVRIDGQIREEE